MRGNVAVTVAVLLASAGCAHRAATGGSEEAFAQAIAGCWLLEPGAWQRGALLPLDRPPSDSIAFQLTTKRLGKSENPYGQGAVYRAATDSFPERDGMLFELWARLPEDPATIHVGLSPRGGGIFLRMRLEGARLVGQIGAFTDAVEEDRPSHLYSPVSARRIPCRPRNRGQSAATGG